MPYSKSHKQQTRQRMLMSAVKLFTRRGFDNTSIDEVMADADLTRGAFYAHFKSKQELYAEAIASTLVFSPLTRPREADVDEKTWLVGLINAYLHRKHVADAEMPCPLAFLATDVALQDPASRQAYAGVFKKMNKMFQAYIRKFSSADNETVMAVTAMMIGGVAIARTLDEGAGRNQLLKSCRQQALALLGVQE